MRNIKHALTERYYAWEDASKLAETDPEISFENGRAMFTPEEYLVPDEEVYPDENAASESRVEEAILAEGERAQASETKNEHTPSPLSKSSHDAPKI
jgi:large subunit ribosomal protein L47